MMSYAISITVLNLILLSILLYIYIKNYMNIKAKFNLGLLMFVGFLVIQKLLNLYFLVTMMDHEDLLGTPMFVLEILELFGFSSLVWITIN